MFEQFFPCRIKAERQPWQFVTGGSYVKATRGRIVDTGYQFELWVSHDGTGETHLATRKTNDFSEYVEN